MSPIGALGASAAAATIGASALLGVGSTLHCAAMCGPIVGATCGSRGDGRSGALVRYAIGRAVGYAILGALVATLGAPFASGAAGSALQAALLVFAALVLASRASALLRPPRALAQLATLRARRLASVRARLDRAAVALVSHAARLPFALGLATMTFPCGALWAALVVASTAGRAVVGALAMVAFSLASLVGVLAPATFTRRFSSALTQTPTLRMWSGATLLAVAVWTGATPIVALARARRADATAKPACPYCVVHDAAEPRGSAER